MAASVYTYVSDAKLLYYTQKLKERVGGAIGGIIDDTATTTDVNKTLSAKKIYEELSKIQSITFEKVDSLPAEGKAGVIYLVSNQGTLPNIYDEYIYLSDSKTFEKIGTTEIDLSNYIQNENMVEITTAQIDALIDTVWPSTT